MLQKQKNTSSFFVHVGFFLHFFFVVVFVVSNLKSKRQWRMWSYRAWDRRSKKNNYLIGENICSYFREYLNSYFIPTDHRCVCVQYISFFYFFFSRIVSSSTDSIRQSFASIRIWYVGLRCTQRNLLSYWESQYVSFSIFRHSLQLEIPNRVFRRIRCVYPKLGFELLCILIDRHAC